MKKGAAKHNMSSLESCIAPSVGTATDIVHDAVTPSWKSITKQTKSRCAKRPAPSAVVTTRDAIADRKHQTERQPEADSELRAEDLLSKPSEYWTETSVYRYFSNSDDRLIKPNLVSVDEMLIRSHGVKKFKVTLKNALDEPCRVWIAGSILFHHYHEEYMQANARFIKHI